MKLKLPHHPRWRSLDSETKCGHVVLQHNRNLFGTDRSQTNKHLDARAYISFTAPVCSSLTVKCHYPLSFSTWQEWRVHSQLRNASVYNLSLSCLMNNVLIIYTGSSAKIYVYVWLFYQVQLPETHKSLINYYNWQVAGNMYHKCDSQKETELQFRWEEFIS